MTSETAGQRVKRLRLSADLTQEQLADAIGRTSRTVANWEADRNRMPKSAAPAVARALGVDIDELNGGCRDN